jgi:hypothetical protein
MTMIRRELPRSNFVDRASIARQHRPLEDSPFEAGTLDLLPGCHRVVEINIAATDVYE